MPLNEPRWVIEVTESQAKLLAYGMNLLFRIRIGQFSELISELLQTKDLRTDGEARTRAAYGLRHAFRLVKLMAFPQLGDDDGTSYGVCADQLADRAHDLHVLIRNTLARSKDDPEERWLVTNDDPALRMVSDWPMAGMRPVPQENET